MGQCKRVVLYQYKIVILVIIWFLVVASPAFSQTGCVGDPCVFLTPTSTTTPGPTPTATPTPTGTISATPQPTPIATVTAIVLPNPNYPAPTSIPGFTLSLFDQDWDALLSQPTQVALDSINTSLSISPSTMLTIDTSSTITNSVGFTFATTLLSDGQDIISSVVSYTGYITGEVAALEGTESLSITAPPAWYAPLLPRDMAAVGWTIELIDSDTAHNYSLSTWSYLFGYMASLPVRLIRSLWNFFRYLGPVGLFLIWLIVVMLPAVLGFRILLFMKEMMIRTFNFLLAILDWIWKLWEAIPFMN